MDNSDDMPHFDVELINYAVDKQDFTLLQKMIVETSHVGNDIVVLLAMCVILHTQVKSLREELTRLKQDTFPEGQAQ